MGDRLRLVLLSFLLLFVELALIRWSGSNVVYLSYFSNFVLLGSFLGIGVGFLRAGSRVDLFPRAPVALALLVLYVLRWPVSLERPPGDILFFGTSQATGPPLWATLALVFVAVGATMAFIAEGVARTFAKFPPLEAYRLDITGSILGIVAFSAVAFLHLPPVAWGIVAAVVFAVLYGRRITALQVLTLAILVAALGYETRPHWENPDQLSWSPYYKIHVEPLSYGQFIAVNGIPHQTASSLAQLRDAPRSERVYLQPYERVSAPKDVLIVGAGTGTDTAIALSKGVRHVDAVEIDPRLQELGRILHPDRPYDDPRVTPIVDDGRAFLERTDRRYDLILFALPDSLTLVSGQSSLRLESYLFTREAMQEAREHLNPGGVFAMYNYYREQWLVDRLAGTLREVYGHAPCLDTGARSHFALLSVGLAQENARCQAVWEPGGRFVPEPARDDYPFLYLRTPHIPGFYLAALGLILAASIIGVRLGGGPFGRMGSYLDLFFMGAAFLLLETKSVVQFALLFGTTWFVNALVFGGILLTVLAAVEVARRVPTPRSGLLYGALFAALAVAFVVPQHSLLNLPWGLRLAAAVALAFAPVFLANLVFAERFKDVGSSTVAFGANLLGAMIGGLLEYSSLVLGYRLLLPIVAAFYGLAFLFGRRHMAPAGVPAPAGSPAGG